MTYTFTVDKENFVIIKEDNKQVDKVGAFDTQESANYWAGEVTKYYEANPDKPYPMGDDD
jgi:hypothetical protein